MKIVKQGQSFLDKVTQLTGSYENALEMAILNNVSITSDIEIGVELKTSKVTNKTITAFFNTTNEPATAYSNKTEELTGIGYMEIGNTFIVQ